MKERDVRSRATVKAGEVHAHQTIEVDGQRLRVDRRKRTKERGNAVIVFAQLPNGRGRTRTMKMSPAKHVTLCLR